MKKTIVWSISSILTTFVYASPNDLFLQATPLKPSTDKLQITTSVDAVNKTIDVFNLREAQGPVSDGAGDYLGGSVALNYQLKPRFSVESSYKYRSIDYSQDTNTIHSWLLGARYTPPLQLKSSDTLVIRGSAWGDFSSELSKSTPTQVGTNRFQTLKVKNPNDIQAQLDAIFSRKLDSMNQLNGYIGFGYSRVSIDSINATAKRQNCLFDLNISSNNQVTGTLIQPPCTINGTTYTELSFTEDTTSYGLDVKKDLNYDALYTTLGASWNWRYRDFESQIAYQYQRLWRNDIDDRVSTFGNHAVKDNHSFGLKLSYDINPKLTAFLEGQLFERNFVGTIPFLYNGITASRLDRRYGLASLGITFHGF